MLFFKTRARLRRGWVMKFPSSLRLLQQFELRDYKASPQNLNIGSVKLGPDPT